MSISLSVIHGPNLNKLGMREKKHYGSLNFEEINQKIKQWSQKNNIEVAIFQSNQEGDLVDFIHQTKADGLIVNLAAYTHTSIALRDALLVYQKPFVEVHLSNVYAREEFRHKSLVSDIALGVISGFGHRSYLLALDALSNYLTEK